MSVLHRTSADLELRSDGDGRTVYGIAVPFGQVAEVPDDYGSSYRETFVRGSFARTIVERGSRVKLLANHDRRRFPIGRPTVLREDAAGLYMEARISKTRDGDEALELIRDGALDRFSIGFRPIRHRVTPERVVERTEVALSEVSLVAFPAYDGAVLAGVRSGPFLTLEAARKRLALIDKDFLL
ncbi:MAG: HK97 family phage prohead protease [Acidimicrobiia bacterium]